MGLSTTVSSYGTFPAFEPGDMFMLAFFLKFTKTIGSFGLAGVLGCEFLLSTPGAQTLDIKDGYGKSGAQYDIFFLSSDTGFVCGDPGLAVTRDGGESWSETIVSGNFRSITFSSRKIGHAVGNDGAYVRTTDGGKTWTPGDTRTENRLRAVAFASPTHGFAVGDNGTMVYTENSGERWQRFPTSFTKPGTSDPAVLTGICFIDQHTGFATGTGGALYKTDDGGKTWRNRSPGNQGIWDIAFPAPHAGFASGAGARCYMTEDSGETWVLLSLPAPSGQEWSLWAIDFINEKVGVAVGGHIFFTNDGGRSWTLASSGGQELRGLYARNDSTFIAIGKASRQVTLTVRGLASGARLPSMCAAQSAVSNRCHALYLPNGSRIPRTMPRPFQWAASENGLITTTR